jgi:hypothetical protein
MLLPIISISLFYDTAGSNTCLTAMHFKRTGFNPLVPRKMPNVLFCESRCVDLPVALRAY